MSTAILGRKFDPNQPRDERGRWALWDQGGSDMGEGAELQLATSWEFGNLVAQIDLGAERRCVYRFSGGRSIIVPWGRLPCAARMEWSALSHGDLLNDN